MKGIIFEDKDIIVCHKKAGVPVQSARIGQQDMVSMLNNYLAETTKKGTVREEIRVIHRLDQPVEGVLVFAKNKKAAASLSRQITEGSMKKIYHAVCCVTDQYEEGVEMPVTLRDYLIKDGKSNSSFVGKKGDRDAKLAELSFRIIARKNPFILAEIDLDTGRHHQIRVQMAHAGLPLRGDRKYNKNWDSFESDEAVKRAGLALCAVKLSFEHPSSGKRMTFQVRPESDAFAFTEE